MNRLRTRQPDSPERRQHRLPTLTIAAVSTLIVGALYFAQAVLIPFALAVLLTFLLTPAVSYLQKLRLSRGAAVALVIVLVFCALGGAAWILTAQIGALAAELPKYRDNIAEKIRYVRSMGKGGVLENVQETVKDLQTEWEQDGQSRSAQAPPPETPRASSVWPSTGSSSLARNLGMTILVLGLVIFMLAQREELRNRLIRVIGYAHLTVTTRALEDAGRRISNYLLMQIAINGCFGLVVGVALFLIGLPYAFLWGLIAVPLLFIPVVGFWTAAALPTILSLAVFREWWWPLAIVALFFVLKTIINMILEPLLYGRSVGVFPVPLLMMIGFWTWLWGGIGLLLATPMTVCLVVFARHVPQLQAVWVLLSDEPAMEPKISFYQRLLATDVSEAAAILRRFLGRGSRDAVYDELFVPALSYAKADLRQYRITEREHRSVMAGSREMLQTLSREKVGADIGNASASGTPALDSERIRIVCCPARDEADEVALVMLRQLLNTSRYDMEIIPCGTLTSEIADVIARKKPPLACIAAISPGGLPQLRYICKRLRSLSVDVKIILVRLGGETEIEADRESLMAAGADQVAGSLCQARDQINNLRLLLSQTPARIESTAPRADVPSTLAAEEA